MRMRILICLLLVFLSGQAYGQLVLIKDSITKQYSFINGITQQPIAGTYDDIDIGSFNMAGGINAPDFYEDGGIIEMKVENDDGSTLVESYPDSYYTQPHYIKILNAGKWGLLDSLGSVVFPPIYANPPTPIGKNLFAVATNGKFRVFNRAGETLHIVDRILFYIPNNGIPFQQDGNWGLMDRDGKIILDPIGLKKRNIFLSSLHHKYLPKRGLIVFQQKNGCGVVNMTGKVIHPPKYNCDIVILENTDAMIASIDGKNYGAVNDKGKVLVDFQYKKISYWSSFVAQKNGGGATLFQYPVPSKNKNAFAPMEINAARRARGNHVVVEVNGRAGLVDINTGKYILEPTYDDIEFFPGEIFCTKLNGTYTLVSNGNKIYEGEHWPHFAIENSPYIFVQSNDRRGVYRKTDKKLLVEPKNIFLSYIKWKDEFIFHGVRNYNDLPFIVKESGEVTYAPYRGELDVVKGSDKLMYFLLRDRDRYVPGNPASDYGILLDENLKIISFPEGYDYFKPAYLDLHDQRSVWLVIKNQKWGMLGRNYEVIIPTEYNLLEILPTRDYIHYKKDGEEGWMDLRHLKK
jgi:hypothetical protein